MQQPRVDEEGDYVLALNGRLCLMWTDDDWKAPHRARQIATTRPFAVINDLLAEAGTPARLFTLYAGTNDGITWLLDTRIAAAVAGSGLIKDSEMRALAEIG